MAELGAWAPVFSWGTLNQRMAQIQHLLLGNLDSRRVQNAGLKPANVGAIVDDRDSNVVFTPAGQSTDATGPWYQYTNEYLFYNATVTRGKGDHATAQSVTHTFTGSYIGIVAGKSPDSGKISVSVDGGAPTTVDLYAAAWLRSEVWEATLSGGTHTITITCLNTKNASSTNYYFYFDGFRIADPIPDNLMDTVVYTYSVAVATDGSGNALYDAGGTTPAGYAMKAVVGVWLGASTVAAVDLCPTGRYVQIRNGPISGTVSIGVYLLVARM